MSFFIADAWAQQGGQAAQEPSALLSFLPLVLILVLFYFLLIRPQAKRAKEHKQMVQNLSKGDEVVTSGGLLGRVTEVGDNFLVLEIADNISVRVQKNMVASLMPKGTMKSS